MKRIFLLPILASTACSEFPPLLTSGGMTEAPVVMEPPETLDPTPPPPPPPQARTVEEFDTTSEEDRVEALAPLEPAGEVSLGTTIASLGNPADPGIWISTPLVSDLQMGRVAWQGNSVNLELRPSGGAAGSGSEISLAAMRLLQVPLTDLPEIEVFAN